MPSLTCARPYARAAFALASQHDSVAAWQDLLSRVALAVSQPALQRLIHGPVMTAEQRVQLCLACAPSDDPLWANFLRLLVRNKRLDLLPEIAELFERAKQRAADQWPMMIESAAPLADTEVADLVAQLGKQLKRQFVHETCVNPDLIGGVVVRMGDRVLDASLRGRLAALHQQLIRQPFTGAVAPTHD